jgi:hypothetical protein
MGDVIPVPANLFWMVLSTVAQCALMYGAFKLWQGQIEARLKAVEGHTEKVEKIAPIEAELAAFKDQIGVEFKNLREDVREMGRAMQALALEMAKARTHAA